MQNKKIAVFFDCENISATFVPSIFEELAKYGEVIIRQAFKDWGSSDNKSWDQNLIEEFAIAPIHVFSSKSGKNSSDLRVQRAVIETINKNIVDTIALVSSDSDFRDLAMYIRANGFDSFGFGESKTPLSLRNAYSTFIQLPLKKSYEKNKDTEIIKFLKEAIKNTKGESEYCLVSQVGSYLKNKNSSYNPKNIGANTWGDIIKRFPDYFELTHSDKKKSTLIVKTKKSDI